MMNDRSGQLEILNTPLFTYSLCLGCSKAVLLLSEQNTWDYLNYFSDVVMSCSVCWHLNNWWIYVILQRLRLSSKGVAPDQSDW